MEQGAKDGLCPPIRQSVSALDVVWRISPDVFAYRTPPFDDNEERIRLDFIVVFPPNTPRLIAVAWPPMFNVATEFNKLKFELELVKFAPFMAKSPANIPVPLFSRINLAVSSVLALISGPVEFCSI